MGHGQTVTEHGCLIPTVASHVVHGILMDDGLPVGHRYSMNMTNRLSVVLAFKQVHFPSGIKKPVFSVKCNFVNQIIFN